MNWKEHANLFANGNFMVRFKDGRICLLDPLQLGLLLEPAQKLENCTLIARKIEDMTDEESHQFDELEEEMNLGDWYFPHPACFLFLLSKGIYPFDQKHFEDGTVIDIKTL